MELSNEQKMIVNKDGKFVVKAPPGSGKTFTLCEKTSTTLEKSKKKIIVLTFSNKASEEIKDRIIKDEKVFVGTIHSFAQHLVLTRGHLIGLSKDFTIVSDEKDKEILLKEIIRESDFLSENLRDYLSGKEDIKRPLDYIKNQKLRFTSPEDLKGKDGKFSELYFELFNAYLMKMKNYNLVDFDDLIYYAQKILELDSTKKSFSKVYGSIFVDEAQDLNLSQYTIIKQLSNMIENVMLIGDPEQSLYGFMNSSSKFMEKVFVDDFNADVVELNNNYRSSKKIVKLINMFSEHKKSINNYPIDGVLTYNRYENEQIEASHIINDIGVKLKDDILESEIAIVGRNVYLFSDIIKQLDSNNIKYNTGHTNSVVFETDLVKYLVLLTRHYCNKTDISIIERIRVLTKVDISNEVELEGLYPGIKNIVTQESFKKYFLSVKLLLDETIRETIISEDEKYLLVNDLRLLVENLSRYNKSNDADNKSIHGFMNDFTMGKTLNFDLSGISLLTIHKSKGLEFKVVYLIGLNEGTLPDYRAVDEEKLREEKNNAFVAFSRAKHELRISSVKWKMMPWGKTRYVNESIFLNDVKELISNK